MKQSASEFVKERVAMVEIDHGSVRLQNGPVVGLVRLCVLDRDVPTRGTRVEIPGKPQRHVEIVALVDIGLAAARVQVTQVGHAYLELARNLAARHDDVIDVHVTSTNRPRVIR